MKFFCNKIWKFLFACVVDEFTIVNRNKNFLNDVYQFYAQSACAIFFQEIQCTIMLVTHPVPRGKNIVYRSLSTMQQIIISYHFDAIFIYSSFSVTALLLLA